MKFRKITPMEIQESLVNLRQLVFEVTDVCNLKCRYCRYGNASFQSSGRSPGHMTFARARLMIDYLAELWEHKASADRIETEISFTGGEPLMNMPMIRQLIEYIEGLHLHRKITYVINTNAVLLDRYAEYLAGKKVYLRIGLDGDEKSHCYRMAPDGSNSFGTVYRCVKELQQMYPDYFAGYVRFQSVLHKRNSVPGILSFMVREFHSRPLIVPVYDTGIRENRKEIFGRRYRNAAETLLPAACLDPFSPEKQITYTPGGTCSPFSKRMFVTVAGQILPCDKIESYFFLGQLTEKNVILDLEIIADKVNAYFDKLKKQCSVCRNNRHCTLCLYQMAGINDAFPLCPGFLKAGLFTVYRIPGKSNLTDKN